MVWLPRNGGRIVFRSRFPDFVGKLVNHCHILQHEDNGMMQPVEIVPDAADANFEPATSLPSESGPTAVTQAMMVEAFRECSRFVDANPQPRRAQEYPATNGCFAPTDQGGGE